MSDDIAIRVENLSKRYIIRHQRAGGEGLRHVLQEKLTAPFRKLFGRNAQNNSDPQLSTLNSQPTLEEFWALKDVSFEVKRGEVVGIIGRNGAGKSTLLKILSRITEPTKGRIIVNGRVASLLEVGTGFHPELTGRENIFLNGAILGMTETEIRRKFDEIVAFAEVKKFIDTPVKRYSSGMYVRLAFAVAAHLEPEILVIDEVLAVGDIDFQKKCLGKMQDVAAQQGRTVLFVSHNMGAIQQLCSHALLLRSGELQTEGTPESVIATYLTPTHQTNPSEWRNCANAYQNPWFKPITLRLTNGDGKSLQGPVPGNTELWLICEAEIQTVDPILIIGYAIYAETGECLYHTFHTDTRPDTWPQVQPGRCILRTQIPGRFLNEGVYRLELIAGLHGREWILQPGRTEAVVTLEITGGLSDSPYWNFRRPGLVAPVLLWHIS